MRHNWQIIFISLIAINVTACGMMPRHTHEDQNKLTEPASVESLQRSDGELAALATTRWWLDYHQNIRLQAPKQIGAEYKSAEAALAADDSLHNRLRIITLLSLNDMPFHNPERALKLLNSIISDEQNHQSKIIRDTATLVRSNILSTQRELQDQKKIQTLSNKLKELQNNNAAIQQQLDALKEIERSIYERRKVEVTNKQ